MEQANQLAARFKEAFLDGKWIANTNYKESLSDVTVDEAQHRVGRLNTIALLTFHMNYYVAGLNQVFEGGSLDIRDQFSFDMKPLETESDWTQLVKDFVLNAETFFRHVNELSEEQLEDAFVDPKYGTYRRNIEGMIEHAYYHLGQISLIKKMIRS